ncbi:MAG: hypothetical protein IMZ50_02610 [Candidatus Atribacteria bacterium]|nr:hypothetical protein [Candidatus Atribacteria bacterium]
MTIKQRIQSLERALVHRVQAGKQQAYMDRFSSEYEKGRVLCRDGVSRPFKEWLDTKPDVKEQLQQIEYGKAVEAVRQGILIDPETKKFIRSYTTALGRKYRKGEDQEFYKRLRLEIKQVRAAKTGPSDQGVKKP